MSDHLERLEAFLAFYGPDDEIVGYTNDFRMNAADLRAAVDELKQLRAEREADDLCARTAAELLAAIVAPDCDTDRYGNCATHGVLVLDAGSQCPHVLARAFLSSARLWLDPAPQQPAPDGGAT